MKIAVIGCTHAGTFAVKTILSEHPDAQVTVYEKNDNISFLSCGIALYLGQQVKDPQGLFYSNPEELKTLGANVKMNHEVTDVDPEAKTITVTNLTEGKQFTDTYDKLVATTGSWPIMPPIQGIDNKNVYLCKNWNHAQELFKTAPAKKRITVVGAGYIGAELAEAYSTTGHDVTLIDGADRVMSKYFDRQFTDVVEQDYKDHGVTLALGQQVTGISGDDTVTITTTKGSYETDLVIMCVGFKPNTSLFKGKLEMLKNGALITNAYMQTSDPDIYAAGDSVAVHYNPTNSPAYIPLATNAVRQGILVGKNIEQPTVKYMGTQSSSGLKLYDRTIVSTGLTMAAANQQGINAAVVTITDNYRPEFMPTTEPVLMSLVYNPENRQILGGTLMSTYDVSQSANTLSVCIQNQNTIDDLAMVDMLFQPQFDRPFNYLNILGQAAQQQLAQQADSVKA
ncbi:FAD-dependent oxidoreductase [Lentilactobacillus farraginis]|uniref:NADH oxidase n=1 Tax=Lentilactobacillus farraginis DSM 18382 = JCM 14108 TaxID=1423743 RepID=X0PKF1_9LACO|nr:FAD-dependent oxidoreductase [Lentilactobacillus farraginis]KRM03780.1 NADH oxidase [Lentilactobacillus farraginis DSM 18382 = JCM 14108]GAF37787.1 NADH peroxidase Npx [Lentilactobacillus farraginis DSM 18382 = JCM 14108]